MIYKDLFPLLKIQAKKTRKLALRVKSNSLGELEETDHTIAAKYVALVTSLSHKGIHLRLYTRAPAP